jgi:hypothetical protein
VVLKFSQSPFVAAKTTHLQRDAAVKSCHPSAWWSFTLFVFLSCSWPWAKFALALLAQLLIFIFIYIANETKSKK